MNQWIITLLFIATLALLPAWLVGSFALGAALGLWYFGRVRPHQKQIEAAAKQAIIKHEAEIIEAEIISLTGTRAQAARYRLWGRKGERL